MPGVRPSSPSPAPFALYSSMTQLHDDGTVRPTARDFAAAVGLDGWTFAVAHIRDNAEIHSDLWELHSASDELLAALTGAVTVHLSADDTSAAETVRIQAGELFVIPAGRWHRLEIGMPTDLLSLTRAAGTRTEQVDPQETRG
ncbi:cupin domain-containing protein [Streptomyces sp. N2-109]|uniref:Cupin domain-containing protein n=1 Tax=Streptomyces gossypii TaxID=2883101 RepID=A0ABT2JZ91_9ACTN|nr:cupin domain-containing protein [Streptomyces gossypii]MCT2593213.1 cupin domain-containing protein [Streptomyces gossypii]